MGRNMGKAKEILEALFYIAIIVASLIFRCVQVEENKQIQEQASPEPQYREQYSQAQEHTEQQNQEQKPQSRVPEHTAEVNQPDLEQDDTNADIRFEGDIALSRGNYAEAVRCFEIAANSGDKQGQSDLADCYAKGLGVEKNPYTAVHWLRKAAEQDHEGAELDLGLCYCLGFGVEQNIETGKEWLCKATAHEVFGYNASTIDTANRFLEELNKADNCISEEMQIIFRKSLLGELYIPAAIYTNTNQYDSLTPDEAYRACERTTDAPTYAYLESAARRGNNQAKERLAKLYLPIGCKYKGDTHHMLTFEGKNLSEADRLQEYLKLMSSAADNGSLTACLELRRFYSDGAYTPKDSAKYFHYTKAAVQLKDKKTISEFDDIAQAIFDLGICYAEGIGCQEDRAEAVKWIKHAVKAGNAEAKQWIADRSGRYEETQGMSILDKSGGRFSMNNLRFGDSLQTIQKVYADEVKAQQEYDELVRQRRGVGDNFGTSFNITQEGCSITSVNVCFGKNLDGHDIESISYLLEDNRIKSVTAISEANCSQIFSELRSGIIEAGYGNPAKDTGSRCEWNINGAEAVLSFKTDDNQVSLLMKCDSLRTWQKAKIEGWEDLLK